MKNSRLKDDEMNNEAIERSKKAMHLIGLIRVYKEFVLTAREVAKHLKTSAIAW